MRTRTIAAAMPALGLLASLTACGGGEVRMRPGEWEMKATSVNVSGPGVPPGMKEQMQEAMTKQPAQKQCVTEEEVDKMVTGAMGNNESCTSRTLNMRDGTIDAELSCRGPGGQPAIVRMKGSYEAESLNFTTTTQITVPGQQGQVNMEVQMTGRRIGECSGSEAKA